MSVRVHLFTRDVCRAFAFPAVGIETLRAIAIAGWLARAPRAVRVTSSTLMETGDGFSPGGICHIAELHKTENCSVNNARKTKYRNDINPRRSAAPPRSSERASGKIAIYIGKRKNRLNACDFSRTIDFLIPRLQLNVVMHYRKVFGRKFRTIIVLQSYNINKKAVNITNSHAIT